MSKFSLWIIIFLLLFFRVILLAQTSVTFFSDDAISAEIARFWIQGKWNLVFHPTWQPLYPFLGAISYLFIGNWENAMRLVSAVSGYLLVLPLFFLTHKLLPKMAVVLFLISITFFTPILNRSLVPMSDMLFTLLIVTSFTFVAYFLEGLERKYLILAAVFFSLANLTRSEGFIFFVLTLAFIFVFLVIKKYSLARIMTTILVSIFAFVVISSPYLVATRIQTGKWTFSQKGTAQIKQGHAFQVRSNGLTWSQEVISVKEPSYKSSYYSGGISHLLEYSDWYFWWFNEKLGKWASAMISLFPIWSIVLIIIGIIFSLKSKYKWFFIYFAFIFLVITPLTIFATPLVDIRYLLWAFPFLILLIYMSLTKYKKLTFLAFFISIFLPSFSFYPFLSFKSYTAEYSKQYSWNELAVAGNWLNNQEIKNPRVMMRHEGVEFYADGYTVYTPQEYDIQQTVNYAKKLHTDYLIAWSNEIAGDKYLAKLLQDNYSTKYLTPVFSHNSNSRKIVIYKIIY